MKEKRGGLLCLGMILLGSLSVHARLSLVSVDRLHNKINDMRLSGALTKEVDKRSLCVSSGTKHYDNPQELMLDCFGSLIIAPEESLIKTFLEKQQQSPQQALRYVMDTAASLFLHEQYPFIFFIHTLKNEMTIVEQSTNRLFSAMALEGVQQSTLRVTIQEGLDTVKRYKANLTMWLTGITMLCDSLLL